MRLWHKDLIPVLPRQQLISQWRECCCIAKNIADNGTPNHLLVNKVLNYYPREFYAYTQAIKNEMKDRGYKVSEDAWGRFNKNYFEGRKHFDIPNGANIDFLPFNIFSDWHTKRYFLQCFYNLQEKFDCYGMSHDEWRKIRDLKIEKYGKE